MIAFYTVYEFITKYYDPSKISYGVRPEYLDVPVYLLYMDESEPYIILNNKRISEEEANEILKTQQFNDEFVEKL